MATVHSRRGAVFLFVTSLLLVQPSWAQDTGIDELPVMSLPAVVGLALRNNRTIKTAQVAREAQKFAVRLQESLFKPQLSIAAGASATKTNQKTYSTTSVSSNEVSSLSDQLAYAASVTPTATLLSEFGTSYTLQWNNAYARTVDRAGSTSGRPRFTVDPKLTIEQPLLKGFGRGVNTANLEIARLNETLGRLSMRNTVSQTITSVVNAYWQVVLNKEQLNIARQALIRARQVLEINGALVASGRMAELDTIQTETDVAQKEFSLDVADNAYRKSKTTLLALLALPENIDFTPAAIGAIEQIQVPLENAHTLAEQNRLEIAQAIISHTLAKVSLMVAKDGLKWDLKLTGSAESNNTRRSVQDAIKGVPDDSNILSIGASLSIPLTSLSEESQVVSARGDLETAALRLAETRQTVHINVQDTVREVVATFRQLQLAERASQLAEQQLNIERDKLSIGRSSNFQVLSYQDALSASQLNEVSARVGYLTALANLDFSLGTTLETWNVEATDTEASMFENVPLSLKRMTSPPGQPGGAISPPPAQ